MNNLFDKPQDMLDVVKIAKEYLSKNRNRNQYSPT
jgi:hypothetical protein